MNYLDYIFIIIIVVSGLSGLGKGLIKTVFNLISTIASLVAAYLFYPYVSEIIINNFTLYDTLREKIMAGMDLEALAQNVATKQDQIQLIKNLDIPNILKNTLITNNNSEIYQLLDVGSLEAYISSYLANMAINAISFIGLMIAAGIIISIIASSLELVAKLPVIKEANKLGGLIVGVAFGVIQIWIFCVVLSIIVAIQGNGELLSMIEASPFAKIMYENNMLMQFLSDITKTLI